MLPLYETNLIENMYTTTTSSSFNDSEESKYTVADILSSMASGTPMTSNYTTTSASFVSNGLSLVSTPLLTPTTLASLEQTFIELQSVPATTTAQDLSRHSGFVPPVVDPVSSEFTVYNGEDSRQDPEWMPTEAKRARSSHGGVIVNPASANAGVVTSTSHRRGGRKPKHEECDPEEDKRRYMRRERNKLAAARCRQRRVDLTNKLINETDNLEEQQAELQNEIQTLQQQKEQLEFLLQAHTPVCSVKRLAGMHVKAEPMDTEDRSSNNSPADLRINIKPDIKTATVSHSASGLSRPTSLALRPADISVTEATGISINTPSSGIMTLNTPSVILGLESMMDGHTGLTPLVAGPSCASQLHRVSTDSSSGNENLSSPTLCAL